MKTILDIIMYGCWVCSGISVVGMMICWWMRIKHKRDYYEWARNHPYMYSDAVMSVRESLKGNLSKEHWKRTKENEEDLYYIAREIESKIWEELKDWEMEERNKARGLGKGGE